MAQQNSAARRHSPDESADDVSCGQEAVMQAPRNWKAKAGELCVSDKSREPGHEADDNKTLDDHEDIALVRERLRSFHTALEKEMQESLNRFRCQCRKQSGYEVRCARITLAVWML